MRRSFWCLLLIAGVSLPAAAAAGDPLAPAAERAGLTRTAQAGSVGGVVGKQGKSVSGGEDAPAPRRPAPPVAAAPPAPSPCNRVPGVWSWFIGPDVTFHEGGRLTSPMFGGTWSCRDRQVVISWSHGFVDRLTLSPDGTQLSGTNQVGTAVSGSRKSPN
jgi:hypothetical protein